MGAALANSKNKKATKPTATPAAETQASSGDMVKQLTDLKGLLDAGILTQEEFDSKKKEILAS